MGHLSWLARPAGPLSKQSSEERTARMCVFGNVAERLCQSQQILVGLVCMPYPEQNKYIARVVIR